MKTAILIGAMSGVLLAACGGNGRTVIGDLPGDVPPSYWTAEPTELVLDGVTDDLQTGGGLNIASGAVSPAAFAQAGEPSLEELRRFNLASNYNGMLDPLTPGGWGVWWGPTVSEHVRVEGLPQPPHNSEAAAVSGTEYSAIVDDGSGRQNVKLVVQVPSDFNPDSACIVAGPSSGSRGVYGAVATAGLAGFKRGCAVALTDKGTGDAVHLVGSDEVLNLDGEVVAAGDAGVSAAFVAQLADGYSQRVDPRTATTKHAHSMQNPEAAWGLNTLQSIELAFYVLNKQFPEAAINKANTTVVAASWSNGGRAVLMAAEQDSSGLIDGVVSVEPSAALDAHDFRIEQGQRSWGPEQVGWSLYDHHAFGALYQTCANNLLANDGADLTNAYKSPQRCVGLKQLGLLSSDSSDTQVLAQEAQDILNTEGGFLPEQNLGIPGFSGIYSEITATYGNSYGRYRLSDELCGISFATFNKTNGAFEVLSDDDKAQRFVGQNMIAGGGRWIQPVNLNADDPYAVEAFKSTADYNLDADLCFFAMSQPGRSKLQQLGLLDRAKGNGDYERVQAGIAEAAMSGDLGGKPAIVMLGRADQVVAPNHGGRAWYARNRQVGGGDEVVYWEVEHGHHLEMFGYLLAPNLGFYSQNYQHRYAYMHPYFDRAVELMFAHLKEGQPLPPSQVIRTTPMSESGEAAVTAGMFGPVKMQPGTDAVSWADGTLSIPD